MSAESWEIANTRKLKQEESHKSRLDRAEAYKQFLKPLANFSDEDNEIEECQQIESDYQPSPCKKLRYEYVDTINENDQMPAQYRFI